MAKNLIKKNVEVKVIAGSHKGATGKVLKISKDRQRVTVDKVNIVKKHNKPTQQNPDGGIQEFEAPIHISNVKIYIKPKKKEAKKAEKADAKKETNVKTETKPKAATPKETTKPATKPAAESKPKVEAKKPVAKDETKKDEK